MDRDVRVSGPGMVVWWLLRRQTVLRELGDYRGDDVAQFVGIRVGEVVGDERLHQGLAGDPAAALGGHDSVESAARGFDPSA